MNSALNARFPIEKEKAGLMPLPPKVLKQIFLLVLLLGWLPASGQSITQTNFTGTITPQYMASATSAKLPVMFRATISGLIANTTYRYFVFGCVATDFGSTNGAGGSLLINSSGTAYTYASNPGVTTAGTYETITTGAGQTSYTGWFGMTNSSNTRFTAGNLVYPCIVIANTSGTIVARYALDLGITPLNLSTSSGTTTGSFLQEVSSNAADKNVVCIYDNTAGAGRPMYAAPIENIGATIASVPSGYTTSSGGWNAIIPNSNANGLRRIERSVSTGNIVGCAATDADGVWPTGPVSTVNPTNGATAKAISNTDASLDPTFVFPRISALSSNSPICSGTDLNLSVSASGTPAVSYSWSGPGTFSPSVSASNPIVSGAATGTYTVTVSNSCGTVNASTNVTVNSLPSAAISSNNSPICSGSNAMFTISGTSGETVTYNINGANGTTNLVGGTAIITVNGANADQTLNLISVNDANCSQTLSGSSTVVVNQAPAFTLCPSSPSASQPTNGCYEAVSYSYIATGSPTPTITHAFAGATNSSGTQSGDGSGANFYKGVTAVTLSASNGCGPNATCSFNVTVNAPEVSLTGNGDAIVDGSNSPQTTNATDFGQTPVGIPVTNTYTITNSGTSTLTIYGVTVGNGFSTSGIAANTTVAPNGTKTFTITYDAGSLGIHTANVLLATDDCDNSNFGFAVKGEAVCALSAIPVASATPVSQTICNKAAMTTIVLSSNVSGTTYDWIRDNTSDVTGIGISGSGNISGSLTNSSSPATQTTTFTITPTANGCPGASVTASVTVLPALTASLSVTPLYPMSSPNQGEVQTIYYGYSGSAQSETLTVNASGGSGAYSYAWTKLDCSNGTSSLSAGAFYTFNPAPGDICSPTLDNVATFDVTVTDDHGCGSKTLTKRVNVVNPFSGTDYQLCHKTAMRGSTLYQTMVVPPAQVATHLGHGDLLGGNCTLFAGRQLQNLSSNPDQFVLVYPNPSTGVFIVELAEVQTEAAITVADVTGKVITAKTLTKGVAPTATFDMSPYAKGVYLLQVRDGGLNYRTKVIIE